MTACAAEALRLDARKRPEDAFLKADVCMAGAQVVVGHTCRLAATKIRCALARKHPARLRRNEDLKLAAGAVR